MLGYTGYPRILSIAGLIEQPGWDCPGIYWVIRDTKYYRVNTATWMEMSGLYTMYPRILSVVDRAG